MDTTTPPPVGPGVVSRRTLAAGAAWSVPVIMAASAAPAMAASGCSGPRYSTDQAGTWSNMVNVEEGNPGFASVSVSSGASSPYLLTATNFGFTTAMVPAGSTIVSVQIEVRWYVSGTQDNGAWFQIQARAGGAQVGNQYTNTYAGSGWPTTAGTAVTTSYLLTGTLPTAAQIVATTFGAQIGFGRQSMETNYTAYCDFIRITVCYR